MKKIICFIMTLIMVLGISGVSVLADSSDAVNVCVTISDGSGKLVLAQETVSVTDIDNDGALTVNDALYAAHEAKYQGGAASGYSSYTGDYGLSLGTLWGDNSGSFGYYLNNVSCMSLADTVKNGDYINAFVYTDLTSWSDAYSYFNVNTASAKKGESVTLTLLSVGFDAEWNTITVPVEGATVTVDGIATSFKTDADGKVTLTLDKAGELVISATSETEIIVPPVCRITVEDSAPGQNGDGQSTDNTDDNTNNENNDYTVPVVCAVVAVVVVAGVAVYVCKRKKN